MHHRRLLDDRPTDLVHESVEDPRAGTIREDAREPNHHPGTPGGGVGQVEEPHRVELGPQISGIARQQQPAWDRLDDLHRHLWYDPDLVTRLDLLELRDDPACRALPLGETVG